MSTSQTTKQGNDLSTSRLDSQENPAFSYRVNVVQIPRFRLGGFSLVVLGVAVHNILILNETSLKPIALAGAILLGYSFASWLALFLFWSKLRTFDLSLFFLILDVFFLSVGIYFSGGEKSLLFFLLLTRTADQSHARFERLLLFAHVSVFSYLVLLSFLVFVDHHSLRWSVEVAKLIFIYGCNLYLCFAARSALRNRKLAVLRLTRQLEDARKKAEEASFVKGQFLASMSHELRTPLHSIIGFANLLIRKKRLPQREGASYISRIRANGAHLLNLIDDILQYSALEVNRMRVRKHRVSLNTLVRETVRGLEGTLPSESVKLVTRLPQKVRTIETDEGKLKQVLINLLSNAMKFTEEGRITVQVNAHPRTHKPESIEVTDTGIGIADDLQEAIFLPFRQGDGRSARKYPGTGLGLAISKSLCELLGYRLEMTSKVGEGSTFRVRLSRDMKT